MIKWIKTVFRRLGREDNEDNEGPYVTNSMYDTSTQTRPGFRLGSGKGIRISAEGDDIQTDEVFSFKVFSAGGGKVIEFRSYDRVKDKSNNRLHLISDDEDFAAELGRIVLFELMRS